MDEILCFDTETTTDETQRLTFGVFRYGVRYNGRLSVLAEGIVYADELPESDPAGFELLKAYATTRAADVDMRFLGPREPDWQLAFLSRAQFVERWIWDVAYQREATVVGFNLPFDLSRLAVGVTDARGAFSDGFSFQLWHYNMRPNLRIKHLDSKKSFIGWALSNIPGAPKFRGKFVDLRTLSFALTNVPHSLRSAAEVFGCTSRKQVAETHGVITTDYIGYCRNDTATTWDLYGKVCDEFALHPIDTPITSIYSPASLAKGYYRAMGVTPPLQKFDIDDEVYGQVMSSFFGGRAEVRIRHEEVPVTLLDFTSMYPTVNALMGLWHLLTAREIQVVDATDSVRELLDSVTLEKCFDRETWSEFVGIARIIPDGDVVPVRAQYGSDSGYNIGINYLSYPDGLWYSIPDLIASVLLSGKRPHVVESIRFVGVGTERGLRQVKLRGDLWVEPSGSDFFTWVIEERQRVRKSNPPLAEFLKVLANSGSYGIFAEMVRDDADTEQTVDVFSAPETPWKARVRHPEKPGRYTWPPVATCITAAARLMLAMLERCVTDLGGTWAFCDTDSMAIVMDDHVNADDIGRIISRFDTLSPYNADVVPHLLKNEFEGFCYGISSKRYVLFDADRNVGKYSEHGLGHLRGPARDWKREVWEHILNGHGPQWLDSPAQSQWSVSTPRLYKTLDRWNSGKPYRERIKPFNFLSAVYVRKEHKPRVPKSIGGFQLISGFLGDHDPYSAVWLNKYDPEGPTYQLSPVFEIFSDKIKVVTYGDVLADYVIHPEPKFADAEGNVCGPHTKGQLHRIHVHLGGMDYIGKESNRVEAVQQGLFEKDELLQRVSATDQRWDQLRPNLVRVLGRYRDAENARLCGLSAREYARVKTGAVRPSQGVRTALMTMAVDLACRDLRRNPTGIKDPRSLLTEWKLEHGRIAG